MAASIRLLRVRNGILDLPAEIRNFVYSHVLPLHCPVVWYATAHRPEMTTMDATIYHKTLCLSCVSKRRSCNALMRTCKTLYEKLSVLMYGRFDIRFHHFGMIKYVRDFIRPRTLSLIHKIQINSFCDVDSRGEKQMKFRIQEMIQAMVGLREVSIVISRRHQCEKAEERGSNWKPDTLRILSSFIKGSPHLDKVFVIKPGRSLCDTARITTAGQQATFEEVELDVDAEYQKWLMKFRERRVQRLLARMVDAA